MVKPAEKIVSTVGQREMRQIRKWVRSIGVTMISVSKNLRQALRRAQQLMSADDRLVVFGSFYTVAAVRPLLGGGRQETPAGAAT